MLTMPPWTILPQLIWIGFNTLWSSTGEWVWSDDSPVTYTNFGRQYVSSPDAYRATRQCAALWYIRGGIWTPRPCTELRPFVCKKPKAGTPAPSAPPLPLHGNSGSFSTKFRVGSFDYMYVADARNWAAAHRFCQQAMPGGRLAYASSWGDYYSVMAKVDAFVATVPFDGPAPPPSPSAPPDPNPALTSVTARVNETPFWIGFYADPSTGRFTSTLAVVGTRRWHSSAYTGDYPTKACAAAEPSLGYQWFNHHCSEDLPFLCMVRRGRTTSSISTSIGTSACLGCMQTLCEHAHDLCRGCVELLTPTCYP